MPNKAWNLSHALLMLAGGTVVFFTDLFWPLVVISSLSFGWLILKSYSEISGVKPFGGYANWVTVLRIIGLYLFVLFAMDLSNTLQSAILLAIILLDVLDGFLARKLKMVSKFGEHFDMQADAFFVLLISFIHYQEERIGLWIVATGLMRYLYVLLVLSLGWGNRQEKRTRIGPYVGGILFISMLLPLWLKPQIYKPLLVFIILLLTGSFAHSFLLLRRKPQGAGGKSQP